ncbi:MAG: hypothetical protein JWP82_2817 [Humibacillus sp.]|nr:hypothetical protein [Humibacillus sp.]
MGEQPTKAQWPGKAFDAGGDDLTTGLRLMLEDARLLETQADETKGVGLLSTPQSLQVLTAGSTALTKVWTIVAAALGGGGAIFAAVSSFWTNFGSGLEAALQRSVLMLSAALLASAVVWGVAAMVRADVQGRATAQAALYVARGVYAQAFLSTVQAAMPAPAASTYLVKKGDDWIPVTAFGWTAGRAVALTPKDEIPSNEWSGLITVPSA